MALAIDASSPPVVTGSSKTLPTGSFTPPAGALLLALWAGNSTTATPPGTPTIADSQTDAYTLTDWQSRADSPTVDGQAADWRALAAASTSMTVTSTSGTAATEFHQALGVRVITGQHATPIGAHGKSGSTSAGSIAQNFTATATGSWGFLAVCDWDALGSMAAGTGCTLIGTGTIPTTQISYGLLRRTTADGVSGVATTMNITLAGTSTDVSWVWVEVVPAAAAGAPAYLLIPGRRRFFPLRLWRPGQLRFLAPADVAAPNFDFTSQTRRPRGLPVTRGRVRQTTPPQFNPPFPFDAFVQPRRMHGWLLRPARVRETVPPQFNPPFPFDAFVQPHRVRGLLPRRGRTASPVPPQQAATPPPPFVAQDMRPRIKAYLLRRRTPAGVATPLPSANVPPVAPGRRRPALPRVRRGGIDLPPTGQSLPPLAPVRHRVGVIRSRPARAGTMVPPAPPLTPPARVGQPGRRPHRLLVWARGRVRRFGPPLAGGAAIVAVPGSIGLTTAAAGFGQSAGAGPTVRLATSAAGGQNSTGGASSRPTSASGSIGSTTSGGGP